MLNESLTQANQDQALHLRDAVESLCEKADRLAEPDRTLVRMYLEKQNSFRQMAKLLGVSEVTVARRVKKVIARLSEPQAQLLLDTNIKLKPKQRKIATAYFINGQGIETIARKHRQSCYKIRKIINSLIIYITGPSGTGKSVILRELQKQIPAEQCVNLADFAIPNDRAAIDCIDADLLETLRYFSTAGLADCPTLLNTPANLSEGQQWRFRLALALASHKPFVFADEYCSLLDRITAACISHNIRKFANRYRTTFILASAHDDMLADLLPDVIVTRDFSGNTEITYKNLKLKN